MSVLVVNAGSSSLKVAIFDPSLTQLFAGLVSEIGGQSRLSVAGRTTAITVADHAAALDVLLKAAEGAGHPFAAIKIAAHRVVHGGPDLTATCRVTPSVEAAIAATIPLAPLHNPANLLAVRALAKRAPSLPQYAAFDTAFHATNPEVAWRYALPDTALSHGIRRYGFHGISFTALVRKVKELSPGKPYERLLAFHLGNGASLCAIRDGKSVATTMGYSPLDGLTMGTRSGTIDGNAVLRLAELYGIEGAGRILNRESGLLGLGGASDMRALQAAGTPQASFAIEHFRYWAIRHAGSMIAAMGGLDGIAFTGGIGENDAAMRAGILEGLLFTGAALDPEANATGSICIHKSTSPVAIWIVPAEEERQIAREAMALWASESDDEPAAP
ncbi:MAG TPA: acetate/propionate family kinase [Paracoccaceae bacterium]|nr:acetate/propionate family kinase [Paracoccaceae bacterium]